MYVEVYPDLAACHRDFAASMASRAATLGLCVLCSPFSCRLNRRILVFLPPLCHIVCQRVVRIRRTEESLNREEDGADLECW